MNKQDRQSQNFPSHARGMKAHMQASNRKVTQAEERDPNEGEPDDDRDDREEVANEPEMDLDADD